MSSARLIKEALGCLTGLPMWGAGLAGDLAWFQFGSKVARRAQNGTEYFVGRHALHLSCRWGWRAKSGVVLADSESAASQLARLGSDDCFVRAEEVDADGVVTLTFPTASASRSMR